MEQCVNCRPFHGPDKIVIPLYSVLHTLACESGFSCIGASISCQAVAAPPPLGLGSCTTMDLRPPHWVAIATTHSPNHPVYNVSRILGMPFSFGTACHTLAILLRLSCLPVLHTLSLPTTPDTFTINDVACLTASVGSLGNQSPPGLLLLILPDTRWLEMWKPTMYNLYPSDFRFIFRRVN